MKAFLISSNLEKRHFYEFQKLLGKKASNALFITTAAVPYGLNPKPKWLEQSLDEMKQLTEKYDETSLEDGEYIPSNLNSYDFIFVSGGNSFYLAYRLNETNFDKKITEYIKNGGLYSGSSAGALILTDDINYFAKADDLNRAPKICSGLGVINFVIIPHSNNEKYSSIMKNIADNYKKDNKEIILLNDNQVCIIDGEKRIIV